jgi:hypothetical protein
LDRRIDINASSFVGGVLRITTKISTYDFNSCEISEDLSETVRSQKDNIAPDDLIKFTLKSDAQVPNKTPTEFIPSIIFKDLGFNVSYQTEFNSSVGAAINSVIVSGWNDLKKTFRFINRVKFTHKDYPINADISIKFTISACSRNMHKTTL